MKILKLPTFCFLLAIALGLMASCKSPELTAYKATGVVIVTVDTAMRSWGDVVRAGQATAEQQDTVRAVYEKYRSAELVEKAAILSYKQNHDTNILNKVLGSVAASSAEVIGLIETLLPPEKVVALKGGS